MSIGHYIETLTLAGPTYAQSPFSDPGLSFGVNASGGGATSRGQPQGGLIPEDPKAAVDAGGLLSFVEGLSTQDKNDMLFSIQLPHRGASGAYDRFSHTQAWYKKYAEVLETLGWTSEHLAFAQYNQAEGVLRMDKAALSVIAAIATQNQLAALQQGLQALESLAENDDRIRLFDFHTSAEMSGNFQLGTVQKAPNGVLTMAMGAFYFRSTDNRRRFLFSSWGAQQVDFWTAAQKMTFNSALYSGHREIVRAKLGASAAAFIAELPLG